jgi:hypothetical protein
VAKGVILLSLAALFSISVSSILATPGPLLIALTPERARFPSYPTWLVLPTWINLFWLFVAVFLVWFFTRQIDWSAMTNFRYWHPTSLQKLFLYLVMVFLLTKILQFGQNTLMNILGAGVLSEKSNDTLWIQWLIILTNFFYGVIVASFLWFIQRYIPPAQSNNMVDTEIENT